MSDTITYDNRYIIFFIEKKSKLLRSHVSYFDPWQGLYSLPIRKTRPSMNSSTFVGGTVFSETRLWAKNA
jgi:hypothetical protein